MWWGGKLKLKGKGLDIKTGGVKKIKKRRDTQEQLRLLIDREESKREGGNVASEADPGLERGDGDDGGGEKGSQKQPARAMDDRMTPAKRRFHEQRAKLDAKRLAKVASKSHRQRVEEFNQYMANLSEHYDIPKVDPG